MSNEDLFYICGIALAVSAVLISFIGLKAKKFPGRAFPLVMLWFAILIGGAAAFSVLHAKDEEHEKAAEFEQAGEEFEAEANEDAVGESEAEDEAAAPAATIPLAADVSDLAYDKASLSSKPGKVTIDFTNPSALEHDVAIEADGNEIAGSELIAESETSVSTELAAGTYTFYCTVPGHREAGMEGTLTVK